MSIKYLRDTVEKTLNFIKQTYKDIVTLYLYQLFIILGFFILIHQKFTYEYRINTTILSEIDLVKLIAEWQILVYILIAVPLIIIINILTVRLIEEEYITNKKGKNQLFKHAGKYSFVFITYNVIVFLLSIWIVQAILLENLALKIFLCVLLIPTLLFALIFLRYIPIKTLATGKIINSVKETYAFSKVNLTGVLTIFGASTVCFILFETLITILEMNGAIIYEYMMHLKFLMFILLIILIAIKAAVSFFIFLVEIRFILNLKLKQNTKRQ